MMRVFVFFIAAFTLFLTAFSMSDYAYAANQTPSSYQVASSLRHAAVNRALPPNLVLAIAYHESGFNQSAIGRNGEVGVMQILPSTARVLNAQAHTHYNLYNLSGNLALGTLYLRSLMNQFGGNLVKVISAYNEGGGNVAQRGIFNWGYVHSVMSLMQRF